MAISGLTLNGKELLVMKRKLDQCVVLSSSMTHLRRRCCGDLVNYCHHRRACRRRCRRRRRRRQHQHQRRRDCCRSVPPPPPPAPAPALAPTPRRNQCGRCAGCSRWLTVTAMQRICAPVDEKHISTKPTYSTAEHFFNFCFSYLASLVLSMFNEN